MLTRSSNVVARRRRSSALAGSTEQRLTKLIRKVNALDPELKTFQASTSFTNVDDAAGQIVYVSGIAQGVDTYRRIGDKVSIKGIDINIKVTGGNLATAGNLALYGVYLIKDLQSSGVVPVVSGTDQSIFTNPGPTQAMVNFSTKDRFKILKKWVFGSGMLAGGNTLPIHSFKYKCNAVSTYHDATTAISGAGKNAYYLVVLSDDATDTVDMAMFTEIRFTDL